MTAHLIAPLLALVIGCNPPLNLDPTDDDTGDADGPDHSVAVVTTTDFVVGSLATIGLDGRGVSDDLAPTTGDPRVSVEEGRVLQVNGLGFDTVSVFQPGQWSAPLTQFSVGAGANPHDVAVVDGEAFVTLYDRAEIAVFDLATTHRTGTVDLAAWADDDGLPEVATIVELGGLLYIALQRLDRDNGWAPDEGRVVQVDPASRAVTKSWEVGPNPTLHEHPGEPETLVVRTGTYATLNGGLQVLDPGLDQLGAMVLETATLGYAIADYVESPSGNGLLIAEHMDFTYSVKCFEWGAEITDGEATADWLAGIAVNDRGEAWIAQRSFAGSGGLVVWDVDTCTRLTTDPIETTLPPYRIAFY
jgi:hypothetical protein